MSSPGLFSPLQDWYHDRESREKILILAMSVLAVFVLVHMLIWTPLVEQYQKTSTSLEQLRKDVAWMRKATPELLALRGNKPAANPGNTGSLQTLINQTSRLANMQDVIRRVKPTGKNKVQVRIEKAKFDSLVKWLEMVTKQHAVEIYTISIDRDSQLAGIVNAHIVFIR